MKSYKDGARRGNQMTRLRSFKGQSFGPAGPVKIIKQGPDPDGYWIVVGADRSPTGERQVHHFKTLEAAHKAGFPWAV